MKCPIPTCRHDLKEMQMPKDYFKCYDPPGCGRVYFLTIDGVTTVLKELDKDSKVVKIYPVQI
jgi:hypothetical protein